MTGESLSQAQRRIRQALQAAGISEAELEARYLLRLGTGLSLSDLVMRADQILNLNEQHALAAILARRIAREPLSRIEGKRGFFGLEFVISPAVLDPRPETEHLVECTLGHLNINEPQSVLDLGTGSGAILLAVLHMRPLARGTGVDLSTDALDIAQQNANQLGLTERATFAQGDLFAPVEGRFHAILSNPPYIPEALRASLDPEVRDHDPVLALFAPGDGLGFYRRIIAEAHRYLNPGGLLGFEVGFDQGDAVAAMMREAGYRDIEIIADYAGHGRCVCGLN